MKGTESGGGEKVLGEFTNMDLCFGSMGTISHRCDMEDYPFKLVETLL